MADPVSVPIPQPGWATVVVVDEETGAVGQVPVRVERLSADVRDAIREGLDLAVRVRGAELIGLGSWLDVPSERARDAVIAAR